MRVISHRCQFTRKDSNITLYGPRHEHLSSEFSTRSVVNSGLHSHKGETDAKIRIYEPHV